MSDSKRRNRVRGEGTVFQRKDGSWIARYQHVEYTRGKPISRRANSERDAYLKLEELKQELFGGRLADGTTTDTVKEYMTRWLYSSKRNEVKPQSFDRIESTVNTYIFPKFGQFKMTTLYADEIQDYLNDLFDEGKSYSTVKKIYDAINACSKLGVEKGDLKRNPMNGVVLREQAKSDRKRKLGAIQYYSPEEEGLLVKAATSTFKTGRVRFRMGLAIPLVLNTGLRVGELAALKWKNHIDFKNKTITVEKTQITLKNRKYKEGSGDKRYITKDQDGTKSDSGQRVLQMNKTAYSTLKQLKEVSNGSEYVINSMSGGSLSIVHIDRMMEAICRIAEFHESRTFGIHALRHTFASKLFAKGVDVKIVSELLGHSDVQITYNTYIHIIDSQKKTAIHIIDDI